MMKRNKTATIRLIIAIGLTLLTILFMFWPATASVEWSERTGYMWSQENWKQQKKDFSREQYCEYLMDAGFSKADAKDAYHVLLNYRNSASKPDRSFWDLRTSLTSQIQSLHLQSKYGNEYFGINYHYYDGTRIGVMYGFGIGFNILFWGMLILGVGAIVLYIFNKTRAVGILFAVFAFCTSMTVMAFLIVQKSMKDDITVPNVSMFLMPLFAIGSCIVYQRTKRFENKAKPSYETGNPQPINQTWKDPVKTPFIDLSVWVCPACGKNNLTESNFCANCGTKKPDPGWICPACGKNNLAESNFCANCGTQKPEPEWTCPACGNKNLSESNFCTNCGTQKP